MHQYYGVDTFSMHVIKVPHSSIPPKDETNMLLQILKSTFYLGGLSFKNYNLLCKNSISYFQMVDTQARWIVFVIVATTEKAEKNKHIILQNTSHFSL